MATRIEEVRVGERLERTSKPNGEAMAAFVAAGVGSFAMGLFALLSAADVYSAPSLYEPAGGVSGRTTFAVITWLAAWGILHFRWRDREVVARTAFLATLVLIALGVLGTFPPTWSLF